MAAPSGLPVIARRKSEPSTMPASPAAARASRIRRAGAKAAPASSIWHICAIPTATRFARCIAPDLQRRPVAERGDHSCRRYLNTALEEFGIEACPVAIVAITLTTAMPRRQPFGGDDI